VTLGQVGDLCCAKLQSYGGREMYMYIMTIIVYSRWRESVCCCVC